MNGLNGATLNRFQRFFVFLTLLGSVLYGAPFARGAEEPELPPVYESEWLDEANREALHRIVLKNGTIVPLAGPTTPEQMESFENMDPERQIAFYKNRLLILKPVIALLNAKFGFKNYVMKRLESINQILLNHAEMLAGATEFGLYLAANLQGGAKFAKKGTYLADGFGLLIAFDYSKRKIIVEIVNEAESVSVALPIVAQLAVGTKAMVYASGPNRRMAENGNYFTPPLPVATLDFPSSFAVGPSMGWGLPPGLDVFYSYKSDVLRMTLLRLTVPLGSIRETKISQGFHEFYEFIRSRLDEGNRKTEPQFICLNIFKPT